MMSSNNAHDEQKFLSCDMEFECPRDWFALEPTDVVGVKFCEACKENVHLCLTENDLHSAKEKGWCIAYFNDPSRSTRFRLQRERVDANRNDPNFEPIILMGLPSRRHENESKSRAAKLKEFVKDPLDND